MRRIEGTDLASLVRGRRESGGIGFTAREVAELGLQAAEGRLPMRTGTTCFTATSSPRTCWSTARVIFGLPISAWPGSATRATTATGDVLWTLRYLSPEQIEGRREAVGPRSDIYGLGATLYELLNLRPLFDGENRAEILIRIATESAFFPARLPGVFRRI